MGGVADTYSSTVYDDPLLPPTSQRENIYHVNIHVQVSSSLPSWVLVTVYFG